VHEGAAQTAVRVAEGDNRLLMWRWVNVNDP